MLIWCLTLALCQDDLPAFVLDPFGVAVEEPEWIEVPPLRTIASVRGSSVLADIESRMPAGHHYAFPAAPMTWAHETSHGLASRLRMARGAKLNVLYCLRGRAAVIREPQGTLWSIGARVPQSLRGPSFELYFGEQRRYWENEPTYILDEWVAYTNGSECGEEVAENGRHYELLQALNFSVYAIAMAEQIERTDPQYDDTQLRRFIAWNTDRVMRCWQRVEARGERGTHVDRCREYLTAWRQGSESALLREFARRYFGRDPLDE